MLKPKPVRHYLHVVGASLFAAMLLAACSDDNDNPSPPINPDPGSEPPTSAAERYVGATRVFTNEGSQGYLFSVPSLDAETTVDLKNAIEIENAWVFGDADPYFYTSTIFEPSITRWELDADGQFVQGPTIDFSNVGVTGTFSASLTPIYSAEKSYFVDSGSGRVVIWNPTAMELINTIQIPVEVEGALTPQLNLHVDENTVLVTAFWVSPDSWWTEFGTSSRVFTLDPASDSIVSDQEKIGCEALAPAGSTSDGTVYFSAWDYHPTVRRVFGEDFGTKSCATRTLSTDTTLDPSYDVNLNDLVGGRPAGGLRILNDTEALIHVWHEELVPATPETWRETRFQPGYKWYKWTLSEDTAIELPNQEPSTEGDAWRVLNDKLVTFEPNEDFSKTTLFEVDDEGNRSEKITIPGWIIQMIKVAGE